MIILIDFDRTLFDTGSLYHDLKKYGKEPGDVSSFKDIDASKLLYDGAIDFLKSLKEGHVLILVTLARVEYGKDIGEYQELKVEKSGVTKYFDETHITVSERKDALILSLCERFQDEVMILVDDDPHELSLVHNMHQKIHLIQMQHRGTKYEKNEVVEGAKSATTFEEVLEIIKKIESES